MDRYRKILKEKEKQISVDSLRSRELQVRRDLRGLPLSQRLLLRDQDGKEPCVAEEYGREPCDAEEENGQSSILVNHRTVHHTGR